jgi:hypothetical protein
MFASIPSPSSNSFQLGSFEVHVYGLMYVIALALAILITIRRWEAVGGSRALVYDVAMWGFPAGLSRALLTAPSPLAVAVATKSVEPPIPKRSSLPVRLGPCAPAPCIAGVPWVSAA